VERLSGSDLDHTALVHDGHAVAHETHHGQVVSDQQVSQPVFGPEALEEVQDLGLYAHVERARGLVEKQYAGLQDQGACDGDPLALAS
jgi:hypothetical protein